MTKKLEELFNLEDSKSAKETAPIEEKHDHTEVRSLDDSYKAVASDRFGHAGSLETAMSNHA
jgi:hypothetical protein